MYKLTKKARTTLMREVALFEIRNEYDVSTKSGIAMMKEFMDNNFEASEEVSRTPLIGCLPHAMLTGCFQCFQR